MKYSDELLAERKRLEQEEEALFYEHQEFKQLTEESESMLSDIQHFQFQLEDYFSGSQHIHSIESLYSEGLSQGKKSFYEIAQVEDEIKRERRHYEDKIDEIQREYYQALKKEEENEKGSN